MKVASNPIKLVDIDVIAPAEYNPRQTIDERLEKVCDSLRYLGFVLPLYANTDGMLLSGHQRTKAARILGYTKLPVVTFDPPEGVEKGYNIIFNRGTNDYTGSNAKDSFTEFLTQSEEVMQNLAEVGPDQFPCVSNLLQVPIDEIYEHMPEMPPAARHTAKSMIGASVFMPVVMAGDRIVNGTSRLYSMKARGYTHVDVVQIPEENAEFAHMCLNLLAMDFDFRTAFYDELRYNAFRRKSVSGQMMNLSRAYTYWAYRKWVRTTARDTQTESGRKYLREIEDSMPDRNSEARAQYRKVFGDTIVDMGAGTFHDANILKAAGFEVLPFEPYVQVEDPTKEGVDIVRSKQLAGEWLDAIERLAADDRFPDSVVSSFALNSIPHHKDRMAYLAIAHALCGLRSNLYLVTQSVANRQARGQYSDPNLEPNMSLGMGLSSFKVQKFFHDYEVKDLLGIFFTKVECQAKQSNIVAHARYPRRVSPAVLREALEIEFELPYSDGTTMGLSGRAIEVFSKLTGRTL